MIYVVDSSVAVKWFIEEEGQNTAFAMLGRKLFAPELVLVEVANVLWRKQRNGDIDGDQVDDAIDTLPRFFDELHPVVGLMPKALSLARQLQHSVYDCIFLACAVKIDDAVLVTADERFAAKAASAVQKLPVNGLSELHLLKDL